jgi:CubicO group peptidase (beta-lactamase class C family)
MIKKNIRWIFRIFTLLVIIIGIFIAFNYTLLSRGFTYPMETEVTSSEWYSPKAIVEGPNSTNYSLADSLSIEQSLLDDISSYAEERNSSALLVLHKGQLQLEKYWQGNNRQSTTNSFSMSKTITSLLIGIAIDEGKIKSEKDLVSTYITEWANDDRNKIRIEDLLLMQSGLRADNNTQDMFSDVIKLYLGPDIVGTTLEIPAEKEPGSAFEYNNANAVVLGMILERATGEPIESYTSSKLWQPLGAADAGWWLDSKNGMPKPFCCFFAQAEDWMLLGQLLLQNGEWNNQQLISKEWIAKMLTQSKLERDYGYHIWLNYEDGGSKEGLRSAPFLVSNFQIDGANKQLIYVVPEFELVIGRLGNKPNDWDESYLVNKIVASLKE